MAGSRHGDMAVEGKNKCVWAAANAFLRSRDGTCVLDKCSVSCAEWKALAAAAASEDTAAGSGYAWKGRAASGDTAAGS